MQAKACHVQRAIDKTALWKKKKVAPILGGLHLQYMRI
jgi:hypothetical protein